MVGRAGQGGAGCRNPGRRRRWAALPGLAAALLLAQPAAAQWTHMFPEGPTLNGEDIAIVRSARNQLLSIDPPAIGHRQDWSNPQTGSQGAIILEGVSQQRGMPCRRLRYIVRLRGVASATEVTQEICRTPDGSWKFL